MSWCGKCPRWPISSLCNFYIRQPMKRVAEPVAMRCLALQHTAHANFLLTSVTSPQAWGPLSFSLNGMKWERAHEREKSTVSYQFSVPAVVTSHAFGHLFRKTRFASIPRHCDHHFDFIVRHLCCSTVTHKQKRLVVHHIFAHGKQHSSVS